MSRSGRRTSTVHRATGGAVSSSSCETWDATRLAFAIAELTGRFDAMELRAGAAGRAEASPPAAPVSESAARLEAVERHIELLAARVENSTRDGCERREAAQALEEGVTQVAGQIRRGEARAELHALQVRESLWALRRRVERMEAVATSAPADVLPSAGVPEDALARLADRLDAVEAGVAAMRTLPGAGAALEHLLHRVEEGQQHTLSALATLGGALAGLEQLVRLAGTTAPIPPAAGAGGDDIHRPSLAPIDGSAEAQATAAKDASLDVIEAAVRELAEQVADAEQRSSRTVNLMGHEVVRMAQHLDGRVEEVERRSGARSLELGDELGRLSRAVEERLELADHVQVDALRAIGGQIATIASQLTDRIDASELTSAAAVARGLAGVTEQLHRTSDSLHHRFETDAQAYAVRLRKTELQLDRLSAEAASQPEATDLQPLVLGEAERRGNPSETVASISPLPVQQAPPAPRPSHQPGPTPTAARERSACPSPFEGTRAAALDRIRAAERAGPSETGPSNMLKSAEASQLTRASVVPVLVAAPHANSTRELIDAARAAARSAAETSTRGARSLATLHLEPGADTSPGVPKGLRAGLSLLRERARAR